MVNEKIVVILTSCSMQNCCNMSPRTNKQWESLRAEKRELIKQTALELFANEGFHSTSIEMIAQKAKISKGLLYNYFESKEDLLKEIIYSASNELWEKFDPNHDGILTDEEFIYFIRATLYAIEANPLFWRLYTVLMLKPNIVHIIGQELIKASAMHIHVLLEYIKIKAQTDVETEMFVFSSMLKGAILQFVSAPEMVPMAYIEKHITSFYAFRYKIDLQNITSK